MAYWFVSHASADNDRLAPIVVGMIDAGLPLWFDRPGDIGVPNSRVAGFIREGQIWSDEILLALSSACGMVFFPSSAARASEECRLEIAFARTFALVSSFRVIPILIDDDAWRHFDVRVQNIQGVRLDVVGSGSMYQMSVTAQSQLRPLVERLLEHLNSYTPQTPLLEAASEGLRLANTYGRQPLNMSSPGSSNEAPSEFHANARRYRACASVDDRAALDQILVKQGRSFRLGDVVALLRGGPVDEGLCFAMAMALAVGHMGDRAGDVAALTTFLFGLSSERVRYRVAMAIHLRARALLVAGAERAQLLAILETALALETNAAVSRELTVARDAVAASRSN
jgi:hypothetical protein